MSPDKQVYLLDDLQSLLQKQIELARQNNISNVEALSKQAGCLVEKIAQTRSCELAELKNRQKCLVKLYKKLLLIIAAKKEHIGRQLRQISNGRKTLEAYSHNG